MAQQPPVSQVLLFVETSLSHSDTPYSVGLPWTSDRSVAENYTWQHTTLTRDRHPCLRRDSTPQSQEVRGCRPKHLTARPPPSASVHLQTYIYVTV